ncbi:MAG TPA: Hsp20/alpha crystallin family protein [Pricia sp.]|uniref:Hsp20/alpha crystallin family protein n=1 Tax=Pricia antarctica TaxID=641691 RepID=A0A831QNC0_9FLAO|nr:Hsp20/alpha crystallin family protein [Pricia sp.]HEA19822.1 Hsp20/alpha crystallin family protein [Pricia antarctica]
MSLVKFNSNRWPWNYGLSEFFDREGGFSDDFFNLEKSLPAMNVKEHKDDFEIELASPGFEKKDFEITLKDDILEVAAEKKAEQQEKENDYTCKEFNYRSFRRSLQLPKMVDDTKEVKATYKNGILRLHLMKKEEAKQQTKRKIVIT